MEGVESLSALRADVGAVAFGAVLVALGLAVGAFALARRRAAGARLLLLFAPIVLLYGLRLAAGTGLLQRALPAELAWRYVVVDATYLLPVLFLAFFEELHGPGWLGSLRFARWLWFAYAAVAVPLDFLRGPGFAMRPNSVLVVLMIVVVILNTLRSGRLVGKSLRLVRAGGLVLGLFAILVNLADLGLFPWRPPEAVGFATLVAALCAIAAERYLGSERRLLEIGSELQTAQRIQASLLPRTKPALAAGADAPFALAARTRPATAVGGDLYDWLELHGEEVPRLGVLVADVAGHGVPAALVAAMVKMAHSVAAARASSPEQVLAALNEALAGKAERSFVTALFLELTWDGAEARLRHATAGHPAPLLLGAAEAAPRELAASGPVLGRFRDATYRGGACGLAPGDRVLAYSDGLVEAAGPDGAAWGEARLAAALCRGRALGADTFLDALFAEHAAWCAAAPSSAAGREDDVTVVVLDRLATVP